MSTGAVVRVAGPVVVAEGLDSARLYNVVNVGRRKLVGEVIRLSSTDAVIQVYEDTGGLQVGSVVEDTGRPFDVELGPGLIGGVFDGVQRALRALASLTSGDPAFLRRGIVVPALDRARRYEPTFTVADGAEVSPGDVVATVQETPAILHRIMVPPDRGGVVGHLATAPVTVDEPILEIDGAPLTMIQRWPVRVRRPYARGLDPNAPLVTGQRTVDTLFPVARGGSATIPGGFGTGKTVHEQTLAKWSDADIIVYVGCGERGNEMAEVLEEFPKLTDPKSGSTLMDRTVLIANTSNMPVAAREASIYTAVTIAEYYRDQGYDVALLADSTSRWGEALREVSSRLEEMPGEEGYPAYLPSRLAEFYERAGAVEATGKPTRTGSVTVIGAVSPPGGDFSEPVTQYSLRLAGTFWALDPDLARRRHFPAIHWTRSYSLYELGPWFDENVAADFDEQRQWATALLGAEEDLQSIVRMLGADVLAPQERVTFNTGRLLREDFLQQSAFDPVDAFCPLTKQYWMMKVIRHAHETMTDAVDRVDATSILSMSSLAAIGRMREWLPEEAEDRAQTLMAAIDTEVATL